MNDADRQEALSRAEQYVARVVEITQAYGIGSHAYDAIGTRYMKDIEALSKTIMVAMILDEDFVTIAGGFETLFLYGYLRGQADAREKEAS